jgi:hypothetical protein
MRDQEGPRDGEMRDRMNYAGWIVGFVVAVAGLAVRYSVFGDRPVSETRHG